MAQSEITKLQQHLSLLKQEYTKLQDKYEGLQSKYNALSATSANTSEETFASRLLKTVSHLYDSETYSDIKIVLPDCEISAHKLVLSARSDLWSNLHDKTELNWNEIDSDVAKCVVLWLYTDEITLTSDDLTLKVMYTARDFKLKGLLEKCERALIGSVNVRSCVKFYSVAEEVDAGCLREYCSGLISAHWEDLNSSDFEHMLAPLLSKMLKSKTQLPLHSAVRLQRDDVLFLLLVENSSRLSDVVNVWSGLGELPLELALHARNASMAATLVKHNADVNIRDGDGETLVHRAVRREDAFSALFLLDNNCDVTLSTRNGNDSALHLIAGSTNLEDSVKIAEKIINKNGNVNAQNVQGQTPLHISIMADNSAIFDLLVAQPTINVNLKTTAEGHPPLYYALLKHEAGESSYAERLIKEGAACDAAYEGGDSLLQALIGAGAKKAAVLLVEHLRDLNGVNGAGETALHTACAKNCPEVVDKLLLSGADANVLTAETRQSALHYAVAAGSEDCVLKFVAQEAETVNFNGRDVDGETPISLAMNRGHNGLVPVLIRGGADVNVRNGRDLTLLHQVILKEDAKTALFLLENGADINAKTPEYETPLQLAIHCRLPEVVDALCIRGVDMSAPDRLGNCPLWAALDSGQEDVASVLVRHGADTDCWASGPEGCQQTLLHRAIDENKEEVAVFLIQAGCDVDSPRAEGANGEGAEEVKDKASPLHLCCQWGLEAVVRTLMEHRANVNSRDGDGKTPLHIAIENGHPEIIALLLSIPEVDLSLRDKSGLSPFAAALTFRNNKAAQSILDKFPAAAEQFDTRGQNFLHTAIKKGDLESVLFLLSVQVDVNSKVRDSSMTTPLHLAAASGNETLVRSLLLAGARIDARDAEKQTALHVACRAGNTPVVSALLQNSVDFDALDVNNDNALHVAVREGHLSVVRALLTESQIDAGAVNFKGCNPLHVLCRYGKENSGAIFDLFLECMPDYPINQPDVDGNSPLLMAYMKGNGGLCRALVKAGACLASENAERVTIFNYQVATKQLLVRLLDQLAQQGQWITTDMCQECGKNFSITVRPHHCRHCGRALCSKCSDQEVPIIKFMENKPVRVCKVCFEVLRSGAN